MDRNAQGNGSAPLSLPPLSAAGMDFLHNAPMEDDAGGEGLKARGAEINAIAEGLVQQKRKEAAKQTSVERADPLPHEAIPAKIAPQSSVEQPTAKKPSLEIAIGKRTLGEKLSQGPLSGGGMIPSPPDVRRQDVEIRGVDVSFVERSIAPKREGNVERMGPLPAEHHDERRRPKTRVSDIVTVAGLVGKKWANEECGNLMQNITHLDKQVANLKRLQATTEKLRRKRARQYDQAYAAMDDFDNGNFGQLPDNFEAGGHLGDLKEQVVSLLRRYRKAVEDRERSLKSQFAKMREENEVHSKRLLESAENLSGLDHKAIPALIALEPGLKKAPPPSASLPAASASASAAAAPNLPAAASTAAETEKDGSVPPSGGKTESGPGSVRKKLADMTRKSENLQTEVERLQDRERVLMKEKELAMEKLTKMKFGKTVSLMSDRRPGSGSLGKGGTVSEVAGGDAKSSARVGKATTSKPVGILKKKSKPTPQRPSLKNSGRANRKSLPRGNNKYKPPPPPPSQPAKFTTARRYLAPSVPIPEVDAEIPSVADQAKASKNFPAQLGKQMDKQAADLLALIVTVWLLQDEGRSEPPKKMSEKQDKWVETCVQSALGHAVRYLEKCTGGIMSARRRLLDEMDGEAVETGWISADDDNGIEEARLNYKLWDPPLRDVEWQAEKRVLSGLNRCIKVAMTHTTAGRFAATIMYATEIARKALADCGTTLKAANLNSTTKSGLATSNLRVAAEIENAVVAPNPDVASAPVGIAQSLTIRHHGQSFTNTASPPQKLHEPVLVSGASGSAQQQKPIVAAPSVLAPVAPTSNQPVSQPEVQAVGPAPITDIPVPSKTVQPSPVVLAKGSTSVRQVRPSSKPAKDKCPSQTPGSNKQDTVPKGHMQPFRVGGGIMENMHLEASISKALMDSEAATASNPQASNHSASVNAVASKPIPAEGSKELNASSVTVPLKSGTGMDSGKDNATQNVQPVPVSTPLKSSDMHVEKPQPTSTPALAPVGPSSDLAGSAMQIVSANAERTNPGIEEETSSGKAIPVAASVDLKTEKSHLQQRDGNSNSQEGPIASASLNSRTNLSAVKKPSGTGAATSASLAERDLKIVPPAMNAIHVQPTAQPKPVTAAGVKAGAVVKSGSKARPPAAKPGSSGTTAPRGRGRSKGTGKSKPRAKRGSAKNQARKSPDLPVKRKGPVQTPSGSSRPASGASGVKQVQMTNVQSNLAGDAIPSTSLMNVTSSVANAAAIPSGAIDDLPAPPRVNRTYLNAARKSPAEAGAFPITAQMGLPSVPFRNTVPQPRHEIPIQFLEGNDLVGIRNEASKFKPGFKSVPLDQINISPSMAGGRSNSGMGSTPLVSLSNPMQTEIRQTATYTIGPGVTSPPRSRKTGQNTLLQAAAKRRQVGFKSIPAPPRKSNAVPFESRNSGSASCMPFEPSSSPRVGTGYDYGKHPSTHDLNVTGTAVVSGDPYRGRDAEATAGMSFGDELMANPPTPSSFPGLEGYINLNDNSVGMKRVGTEERASLPATPSDFPHDRPFAGSLNSPINFEKSSYPQPDPFTSANRNPYNQPSPGPFQPGTGGGAAGINHLMNPQQQQRPEEAHGSSSQYAPFQPRSQSFHSRGHFQRGQR